MHLLKPHGRLAPQLCIEAAICADWLHEVRPDLGCADVILIAR